MSSHRAASSANEVREVAGNFMNSYEFVKADFMNLYEFVKFRGNPAIFVPPENLLRSVPRERRARKSLFF